MSREVSVSTPVVLPRAPLPGKHGIAQSPPGSSPDFGSQWGRKRCWPWDQADGLAGQMPSRAGAQPHFPSYKWDRCQEGRDVFEVTQSPQL